MMRLASANLPAGKLVNLGKLLREKALEQALHFGNIHLLACQASSAASSASS
jgi:hypothetical protein